MAHYDPKFHDQFYTIFRFPTLRNSTLNKKVTLVELGVYVRWYSVSGVLSVGVREIVAGSWMTDVFTS